jgi:agmatinase
LTHFLLAKKISNSLNSPIQRIRIKLSNLELFTSQSNVFSGLQTPFSEAKYVIFGVPFDATSTYRTGARFGPNAVRQASLNIETYSFRNGTDIQDLNLFDAGDLHVSTDAKTTNNMVKLVLADILADDKMPVALGGEHTITLGLVEGLGDRAKDTAVISFDAHLDLRCEFMGLDYSHTTFMQLISEQVKPAKVIEVGTRSVCKEELAYAKKAGIEFFTSQQIIKQGSEPIVKQLKERLEPYKNLYITVDMDVLDPAFAPAVQNPEPEGISTTALLDIVCALCDKKVIGFDVVEVVPVYDQGISAIVASKVLFEMLGQIESSQNK